MVGFSEYAVVISNNVNRKTMNMIRVTGLHNEDFFCIYHDEVIQSSQFDPPSNRQPTSLSQMAAVCIKTAKSVLSPEVYLYSPRECWSL